ERRGIAKVEDERTTGRKADCQPAQVRHHLLEDLGRAPRLLVEPDARITVTLPEPLHGQHEIRPHRLRTGIAAPDATSGRRDEEKTEGGDHENAGDIVKFLRPDLEEKQEQPAIGEIEQYGLIGQIRTAIPAQPRQRVVDGERDRHHRPFHRAKAAPSETRIDLLPCRIELAAILAVDRGYIELLDARRGLADEVGWLQILRHRRHRSPLPPSPEEWW